MMQSVYQHLPYSLRSIAASIYGYGLNKRRYSKFTEKRVEEILARDYWTKDQWQAWREERLTQLLEQAATQSPYYREHWTQRRKRGDGASWAYLENWHVLKKDVLRKVPTAFILEGVNQKSLTEEHTSGTSGKPLTLWRSKATEEMWYALFEARVRRWHGVSRSDRWAIFGGQLVVPPLQKKPPYWVWNTGLKQLYCSVYHLSPQTSHNYMMALHDHRVIYILGYPSAIAELAHIIVDQNLIITTIKVVFTNAEMLLPAQREIIQKAFNCPVIDTYGMSELVGAASECEKGRMHIWPDTGVVEVFDDEQNNPLPMGETGRLICTGLINADMPLIRYEVGDRGALASETSNCECGRLLPVLTSIDGRLDDVIRTSDGRKIGRMDPVFKADLGIHEAQIIQEEIDLLRVLIVPEEGFTKQMEETIKSRIKDRVGSVQVLIERVEKIERGINGKYKAVISRLENKDPIS